MVRITIHGRATVESQPLIVSYDDNSNTVVVKDDLFRTYGLGYLQTKDGVGVLTDALTGDYDFQITGKKIFVVVSTSFHITF